jgi:hypothetical protein
MDAPPTTTSAPVNAVADDGPETTPARKATMQAIVQDAYGSADVLELADIDAGHREPAAASAGRPPWVWPRWAYLVRCVGDRT